jgi:hypothetical protein
MCIISAVGTKYVLYQAQGGSVIEALCGFTLAEVGLKGPNKPGHDLFAVAITREDSGAYTFNYVYGNRDEDSASILACLPSQGALFSTLSDIYK